jgi:CBS domain-containing protein
MLRLSDIMTRDVITVTPQTTLRDATELFARHHISGAPVVDGREVVGVVSAADVLGFAADSPAASIERVDQTWDVLDDHTVDEVMTRELWALSSGDDVFTAADLMRRRSIHRVIIIDDEQLVGIVSALDIARAVADHKLAVRTYVFNRTHDFGEPRFPA